jgi:hypothetical protein
LPKKIDGLWYPSKRLFKRGRYVMNEQVHQRFSTEEMKTFLEEYLNDKTKLVYILEILKIKRTRFFELLRQYRRDPDNFSIQYKRKKATKTIIKDVEKNIISELEKEKKLIEDKEIPITYYNYSYIRDQLYQNYRQKAALSTIISRARKQGFYKPRKKKNRSHDREIHSNYIGELIQHDSSHHKFSPYADKKWYLITSLDDYSRLFLFAKLIEKETSWQQDRVVRGCAREGIKTIEEAEEVLEKEITKYNYHQVHSTTGEVPILRFERAIREKKSLFREFKIPSPYTSVKDIFCLRVKRTVDAYHKISLDKLTFKGSFRGSVALRQTLTPYIPILLHDRAGAQHALSEAQDRNYNPHKF